MRVVRNAFSRMRKGFMEWISGLCQVESPNEVFALGMGGSALLVGSGALILRIFVQSTELLVVGIAALAFGAVLIFALDQLHRSRGGDFATDCITGKRSRANPIIDP